MSQFSISDDSWCPDSKFLEDTANEVHRLFFPPAAPMRMRRFQEQVKAAIEQQERHDAAKEKMSRYRKKVWKDPRLRDHAAERPADGWTWDAEFWPDPPDPADTPIGQGAWIPPDWLDEANLPPEPIAGLGVLEPETEVPPEIILAGQYVILAIVHDNSDTATRRGRQRLLTGFRLPLAFRMCSDYGPGSGRSLGVSGFDRRSIERALQDVEADLALVESQATAGARADVQEAADATVSGHLPFTSPSRTGPEKDRWSMSEETKVAAARRLVGICDALLTAGRDSPTVNIPRTGKKPTGRKTKGKKRKKAQAATKHPRLGAPRWEPCGAPAGEMTFVGFTEFEEWPSLRAQLEALAAEAAQLVPIMDPKYQIDFYSDLSPKPLIIAVPDLCLRPPESLWEEMREWVRRREAEQGKSEAEIEEVVRKTEVGLDSVRERQVREWHTQPQWPGCAMGLRGGAMFLWEYALLRRFDGRIKRLKFAAEQCLAARPASETRQAAATEDAQIKRRLPHVERLAHVLAFVKDNADLSEREVARQTKVPASTFRQWPEYISLRKMLAGKVPSGYKTHDGTVEAYD